MLLNNGGGDGGTVIGVDGNDGGDDDPIIGIDGGDDVTVIGVDGNGGGDGDSVIGVNGKLLAEAAPLVVVGVAATLHSEPILGCGDLRRAGQCKLRINKEPFIHNRPIPCHFFF